MNASLAQDNIQPTSPSGNTLLEVDQISLSFGGVKALQDVSFSVEEKQITAIIGPNGAGKTSMLNVINGFYHPPTGSDSFQGTPSARCVLTENRGSGVAGLSRMSPCLKECRL
ncbi:MAG: hypothetical protein CM15mP88_2530 [Pseudomonadota bacterium]|nr:MAG: hypothetical protein CM15mP88_2530 [Pseudomonadota bacterium]